MRDRPAALRLPRIVSARVRAALAGSRQRFDRPDPEAESRFREVFEASPVGMALVDEDGQFVEVNPAWCALLGRTRGQLVGQAAGEFTAHKVGGTGVEKRWLLPDGEPRWVWLRLAKVHGPAGQAWTLVHAEDLTESKRVEMDLQQSQDTLAAVARVARCIPSEEDPRPVLAAEVRWLAQASSVSIMEFAASGATTVSHCLGHDLAGAQLAANRGAAGRIRRGGTAELLANAGADNWGFGDLSAPPATVSCWWQPLSDNQEITGALAVTWTRPIADVHDPAVAAVRTLAEEAASVLTAVRVRNELETLADTDALTGLENRRGWQASLRDLTATARQTGRPLTLALVDLDHFKYYNDEKGHLEGDVLLRTFATRAKGMLRKADVIARWGGEEFAIGLPGCAGIDAGPLLDRLRAVVPDGQTCSIGYATLTPTETGADCLMRADAMLYRAKREGRNRVVGAPEVGSAAAG